MCNYLKLIRIKHYLKNILIFLPLIFSGNLFNDNLLFTTFFAFLSFCFASSIVYVVNDIKDVEKDKLHPTKKNRPLAAGVISFKSAYILIALLTILSILCFLISKSNMFDMLYIIIYIIINAFYSLGLKNIPIVDISILTAGFIIRVLYGGDIIDVDVSYWLYLTIIAFAFYFSLGKRRNEIIRITNNTREVLKYYSKDFLDKSMYMFLAVGIVFYSLWCITTYPNIPLLIWTIPLIIIILMKYNLNIEIGGDGDPIEVVYNDKSLFILIIIYAFLLLFIIYFL